MIKKNSEFNEGVFVLYHALNSIYHNFYGRFPPDIEKSIEDLTHKLIANLESDIEDGFEIEDIKYYQQLLLVPDKVSKKK